MLGKRVYHPLLPVRNSSAPKDLVTLRYEQSPFKMRTQPFKDPNRQCENRTNIQIFIDMHGI